MSVHTILTSRITRDSDLHAVMGAAGVRLTPMQGYAKATGRPAHRAYQAVINGEEIWLFQLNSGEEFIFQSRGWWFRDKKAVLDVMNASAQEIKARREQGRLAAARERAQAEAEAERRRQEAERQQKLEDERRQEHERARAEERLRKQEEQERQRREQEEQIADEAQSILARMAATSAPQAMPPPPQLVEEQVRPIESGKTSELEKLFGRLHQQNAERVIMEKMDELEQTYGISFAERTVSEDQVVQITLRG